MKILYVGYLGYGSTSSMRSKALQLLGHELIEVEGNFLNNCSNIFRLLYKMLWAIGYPLFISDLNKFLKDQTFIYKPDIIWVDKGVCILSDTLIEIKSLYPSLMIVHYNPDDPFGSFGKGGWRYFISAIKSYDVHFIPRAVNFIDYKNNGAKNVIFNIPTRGYDNNIHKPYPVNSITATFSSDVGFLGDFENERYHSLLKIANDGIKVRLSNSWPSNKIHNNFIISPYDVYGEEYAKAICGFKIGLGFLRKGNRDKHTSRIIEIPACGTFLLAERNDETLKLFEEGIEAEFFDSDEELLDKVKFYLKNDTKRRQIALAGRERCIKSGYDYMNRMNHMLSQVADSRMYIK